MILIWRHNKSNTYLLKIMYKRSTATLFLFQSHIGLLKLNTDANSRGVKLTCTWSDKLFSYYWLGWLLTVCSYHVTYVFQSESTLYSSLNVKGTPYSKQARNLKFKWLQRVSRTHNHSIRKRTLNHLTKLAKWLSCVVSTYLYDAFRASFRQL